MTKAYQEESIVSQYYRGGAPESGQLDTSEKIFLLHHDEYKYRFGKFKRNELY